MAKKITGNDSYAPTKIKKVTKRLRLAFIGTGGISTVHLLALTHIPEFEIVAGCDINPERLEWFKQQPGCANAKVYTDYNEMLKKEKLDAVDICTPNGVHCPSAIAALNAGCHVITEKPMAMNPAECQKMVDAAKKNKKLLCVGFQYRYAPQTQIFLNAAKSGLIGDIMYAKVHALRRRGVPNWGVFGQKALQGGGPMIDIGVHMIESCHHAMGQPKPVAASGMTWTFLGDKPSQVYSMWPNWDYKTYTVEDLAVGQVRFENGALMQIESSFCGHLKEDVMTWEIMGTKGAYSFKDHTIFTDLAGAMVDATASYVPDASFETLFTSKLQQFADAILTGVPLVADGEEGMTVQKIIDGIYRSAAKNGAEVKIN